ncbi:hypothetical protein SprV_0702337400 [Sparganum proliferum]
MAHVTGYGAISEELAAANVMKEGCVIARTLSNLMFSTIPMEAHSDERPGIRLAYTTDSRLLKSRRTQTSMRLSMTMTYGLLLPGDRASNTNRRSNTRWSMEFFASGYVNFGLKINTNKSMFVQQSPPSAAYSAPPANVHGSQMRTTDNFAYSGITFALHHNQRGGYPDLQSRQVFGRPRNSVQNHHGHHLNTKLKIYKSIALATLLYDMDI